MENITLFKQEASVITGKWQKKEKLHSTTVIVATQIASWNGYARIQMNNSCVRSLPLRKLSLRRDIHHLAGNLDRKLTAFLLFEALIHAGCHNVNINELVRYKILPSLSPTKANRHIKRASFPVIDCPSTILNLLLTGFTIFLLLQGNLYLPYVLRLHIFIIRTMCWYMI